MVEEEEENISEARGADILKEKRQICTAYAAKEMDHMMPLHSKIPWDKIEQQRNQQKGKTNDTDKGKTPESAIMLWHNVISE